MRHSRSLVTLVETAESETPFCGCGASMIPAEHDGALWLECARHDEARSGLATLIHALVGHDRRLLLAREEMAA